MRERRAPIPVNVSCIVVGAKEKNCVCKAKYDAQKYMGIFNLSGVLIMYTGQDRNVFDQKQVINAPYHLSTEYL